MRRTTALVISLTFPLLMLVCATAFGQSEPAEPPLKVRTELVNVDVLARQKATGRIVSNLGKEDFSVFEDGVQQTISHFSQEQLPLSIVLLVDRAGWPWAASQGHFVCALHLFEGNFVSFIWRRCSRYFRECSSRAIQKFVRCTQARGTPRDGRAVGY